MKRSDFATLLLLAALWGSSYLFMRLGAGEFGAIPFAGLRAGLATLLLLPLVAWRGGLAALGQHWRPIALIGLTQSALPFVLFSYAALHLTTGLSAILGATTPLFTAIVSWAWLGDRPNPSRLTGLMVGYAGVVWLVWEKAALKSDSAAAGLAVAACLLAALLYGFSSNYTKQRAGQVPPLVVAAGCQLASTLFLLIPAGAAWPATVPGLRAWGAVITLAVLCTALAYVLFFRLIVRVGAARTVAVTFLIPAFGVLWGAVFLHEAVTSATVLGCAVILTGTGLTTGFIRLPALWLPKPAPGSLSP